MTLEPLRTTSAVAPSGVRVFLRMYTESNPELPLDSRDLGSAEDDVFWKPKLSAEKGGADWPKKACAMLLAGGVAFVEEDNGARAADDQ